MKVRRNTSRKLGHMRPHILGASWEGAVADAEAKIEATKARLRRLKAALAFCKESLADGDPFPCETKQKRVLGQDSDL